MAKGKRKHGKKPGSTGQARHRNVAKNVSGISRKEARRQKRSGDKFPLFEDHGVILKDTLGDGNCLFRAISDQLYGHEEEHRNLRRAAVEHMRNNPAEFMLFTDALAKGQVEQRRSQRVKSRKASANSLEKDISTTEYEHSFEIYLNRMSKDFEWADNPELMALAQVFRMNIELYEKEQTEFQFDHKRIYGVTHGHPALTAKVAFHDYGHYSSVRPKNGAFSGLLRGATRDLSTSPVSFVSEEPQSIISSPASTPESDESFQETGSVNSLFLSQPPSSREASPWSRASREPSPQMPLPQEPPNPNLIASGSLEALALPGGHRLSQAGDAEHRRQLKCTMRQHKNTDSTKRLSPSPPIELQSAMIST